MAHITKRIGDLQRGDFLMGSRTKVLVAPSAGVHTPSGKVDLRVEWPCGAKRWHTWGRNTKVQVRVEPKVYADGPIPTRDVAGEWDRRDEEGSYQPQHDTYGERDGIR